VAERPAPSTKPILEKLRYNPEQRAIVLNAPPSYAPTLAGLPLEDRLEGDFDFIHVFATHRSDVQRDAPSWREALKENGILWVSYPKGKSIPTDLNRDSLNRALQDNGLQGVSQVAIDDVWSALRFKRA
jgi:hypothetical protein